jgi:hypothetical protein
MKPGSDVYGFAESVQANNPLTLMHISGLIVKHRQLITRNPKPSNQQKRQQLLQENRPEVRSAIGPV